MKAAFYERTGSAADVLRVGSLATPSPGPGEVRVRVRASGINPADVKLRSGRVRRPVTYDLIIPHNDGAGEIDAVGDGVSSERLGQRVWLYNAQYFRPFGTAAEYVVLPDSMAVPLPASTDYAQGACFGIPLLTAYRAVTIDGPVEGMTILVSGGAGAVAHYALQLANAKGARTIATVSSAAKAEHDRNAGADMIIDYKEEDVPARVQELTDGKGVDRIIEVNLSSNAHLIVPLLKPFGTAVVYGTDETVAPVAALASIGKSISYRFFVVYELAPEVRTAAIDDLTGMLGRGEIVHSIAGRYPLGAIADAHNALESGAVIGNVILEIP